MINQIFNEDCLEGMKRIPDGSIDMILCDLPYGTTACSWDTIIPFEPLWEQYKRVVKDSGAVVLTAAQPFTSQLILSNLEMFKYEWIWDKVTPVGYTVAKLKPMQQHENVLVFSKGTTANGSERLMKYFPQGLKSFDKTVDARRKPKENEQNQYQRDSDRVYTQEFTNYPKTIIRFNKAMSKDSIHPTQKPVDLFSYLIKTYTNEGETVLDNCMGSGTTAIACLETGRNYIGFEKDPEYFKLINERIERYNMQLKLF